MVLSEFLEEDKKKGAYMGCEFSENGHFLNSYGNQGGNI